MKKQYAVVVVQLVEWSLPTPEVCGSNHAMGKLLCRAFVIYQLIEKTKKRKRKRPEMVHLKINRFALFSGRQS